MLIYEVPAGPQKGQWCVQGTAHGGLRNHFIVVPTEEEARRIHKFALAMRDGGKYDQRKQDIHNGWRCPIGIQKTVNEALSK